ncbi:MAG: response regulator [Candidatus Sericytochromatia bacterium]|nr:response regulator [Candidatus Sericytochromatia bacterium]
MPVQDLAPFRGQLRQDLIRWQLRSLKVGAIGLASLLGLRVVMLVATGRAGAIEVVDPLALGVCLLVYVLARQGKVRLAAWFLFAGMAGIDLGQATLLRVNNLALIGPLVATAGIFLTPPMVLLAGCLAMAATVFVGLYWSLAPMLPVGSLVRPSHELFLAQYLLMDGLGLLAAWVTSRLLQDLVGENVLVREHSRLKSAFLARMSHEIRMPLNGIVGMAQVLRESALAPAQQASLNQLIRASDFLQAIVNDVLDLSKIEAGHLVLQPCPFDLPEACAAVTALFEPEATRKGLTLTIDIDPATPQWVMADPLRWRQIVTNLVGNAVKFTDQGVVAVSLGQSPADGRRCRLTVTDTGIGIAVAAGNIFDDYVQGLDHGTVRAQGTGLGLSICRQLVTAMGGTIGYTSELGHGSCFTVELAFPAASASDPAMLPIRPAVQLSRCLRILVAEDDPISQDVLRSLLGLRGHEVVVVGNGRDAVAKATAGGFDLALLDLQMPFVDGITACHTIRTAEHDAGSARLPIVVLTAHAGAEWVDACRDAGADLFLTKPLHPEALQRAVDLVAAPGSLWSPTASADTRADAGPVVTLDAVTARQARQAFVQHAPGFMTDLQRSLQESRFDDVTRWAHRLAGALAYVEGGPAHANALRLARQPDQPQSGALALTLAGQVTALVATLTVVPIQVV